MNNIFTETFVLASFVAVAPIPVAIVAGAIKPRAAIASIKLALDVIVDSIAQ